MKVKPALVILAAGIGSRYGGLKQIAPVGPHGEVILDYSVYDALRAGFGHVVFVINQGIYDIFRQKIGRNVERRCETTYVVQRLDDLPPGFQLPPRREKPWGTAHATLSCRNAIDTTFAVINADDFYGRSAFQLLGDYLQRAQDRGGAHGCCLVTYPLENTLTEHGHVSRGVCVVDKDGYLSEIRERTRVQRFGRAAKYTEDGKRWVTIPSGSPVSMNMWGFTPSFFGELELRFRQFLQETIDDPLKAEFLLPEVVGALIAEERATVKVLPANENWYGMTYEQDRPRVERAIRELIQAGIYPEKLWAGSA
jgi:hypothetical protein